MSNHAIRNKPDEILPVTGARDDPVLRAIENDYSTIIRPANDERRVRHRHGESDGYAPEMPTFDLGIAQGRFTGSVRVDFEAIGIRYERRNSQALVHVPEAALPQTLWHALNGTPMHRIARIPGIADWIVDEVIHDIVSERYQLKLRPPENQERPS